MPIAVVCPSCSARFKVADAAAGKRGKCPKCAAVFTVPVLELSPEEPALVQPDRPPPRPQPILTPIPAPIPDDDRPGPRKRRYNDDDLLVKKSDSYGVISVILGSVSLLLSLFACCCVPTMLLSAPMSLAGFVMAFWGRDAMRVLGMVLNGITLLLVAAAGIIVSFGLAGNVLDAGMSGAPRSKSSPLTAEARPGETPFKTFLATRPRTPHTITVACEIGKAVNAYLLVDLKQREPAFASQWGYVRSDSTLGKRLFEILKDAKEHVMTLRLQYSDEGTLEIVDILAP